MNIFEELENARKENERIAAARQKLKDAVSYRLMLTKEIDRLSGCIKQAEAEIKDWEDFLRYNQPVDEAPLRVKVEEACAASSPGSAALPWEEANNADEKS